MATDASIRRTKGHEEGQRPAKRARLAGSLAFPDEYQLESNAFVLSVECVDIHPTLGLPITGGHIRGTVLQIFKLLSRKRAGLVIRLLDAPPYLNCEIPFNEYSETRLPAITDTVYVALKDAELKLSEAKPQSLPFKLVLEDVLIYIEPVKQGSLPRFLEFRGSPEKRPSPAIIVPPPESLKQSLVEDRTDSASAQELPKLPVEMPAPTPANVQPPAMNTLPTEIHRVRKKELRKPGALAQKAARVEERAKLAVTTVEVRAHGDGGVREMNEQLKEMDHDAIGEHQEPEFPEFPEMPETPEEVVEPIQQGDEELEPEFEIPVPQPDAQEPPKPKPVYTHTVYQAGMDSLPMYTVGLNGGPSEPDENAIRLPTGFQKLADVASGEGPKKVNIIGVVVKLGEVKPTAKGDFSVQVSLCDWSKLKLPYKVNLFCKDTDSVPKLVVGQILLLHNVLNGRFNGSFTGTGFANDWRWIGYDHNSQFDFFNQGTESDRLMRYETRKEDLEYFKLLGDWHERTRDDASTFESEGKHKLLSQLGAQYQRKYHNFTVELLHLKIDSSLITLWVTDYTKNAEFGDQRYPDQPRALAGRILRVFVNDYNTNSFNAAKFLKVGKIYKLQNISYKGRTADVPRTVEFRQMDSNSEHPDVQRLVKRKEEFEKEAAAAAEATSPPAPLPGRPNPKTTKPVHVEEPLSGERIVCQRNAPLLTFPEISALPSTGYHFKITARIIDLAPTDHADMVCLVCKQCKSRLYGTEMCDKCGTDEYLDLDIRICFFVVDENHDWLAIRVAGKDAKQLFKLESFGRNKEKLNTRTALRELEKKLRNVVGTLWSNPPSQNRFKDGVEFDIDALANAVQSPWIDLIVHTWQEHDVKDGTWITRFSLMDCVFESPTQMSTKNDGFLTFMA